MATSGSTKQQASPAGGSPNIIYYDGTNPAVQRELLRLLSGRLLEKTVQSAQKPIENFQQEHLPQTKEGIRALPFYNSLLSSIRYQRDQYMIGPVYAAKKHEYNKQKGEQEGPGVSNFHRSLDVLPPQRRDSAFVFFPTPKPMAPPLKFERVALGHAQLVQVGAGFIPSATVHSALLPLVLDLPCGPLYSTAKQGLIHSLPLAQPALNRAVKDAMLNFMDNPNWRQVIKNRTRGLVAVDEEHLPPPPSADVPPRDGNDYQ